MARRPDRSPPAAAARPARRRGTAAERAGGERPGLYAGSPERAMCASWPPLHRRSPAEIVGVICAGSRALRVAAAWFEKYLISAVVSPRSECTPSVGATAATPFRKYPACDSGRQEGVPPEHQQPSWDDAPCTLHSTPVRAFTCHFNKVCRSSDGHTVPSGGRSGGRRGGRSPGAGVWPQRPCSPRHAAAARPRRCLLRPVTPLSPARCCSPARFPRC